MRRSVARRRVVRCAHFVKCELRSANLNRSKWVLAHMPSGLPTVPVQMNSQPSVKSSSGGAKTTVHGAIGRPGLRFGRARVLDQGSVRWIPDPAGPLPLHGCWPQLDSRSTGAFNQLGSLPLHDEEATCLNRREVDECVSHWHAGGKVCRQVEVVVHVREARNVYPCSELSLVDGTGDVDDLMRGDLLVGRRRRLTPLHGTSWIVFFFEFLFEPVQIRMH